MGILRVLLATAVFISHAGPVFGLYLIPSELAVQAFFMISGFYMALILNGKYSKLPARVFWINRLSKIFGLYLLVLAGCVVASLTLKTTAHIPLSQALSYFKAAPSYYSLYFLFTNLFIVGQDIFLFFTLRTDTTLCLKTICPNAPGTHFFFFIPQAWSLSLELYFYALAPALARLSVKRLAALTGFILLARLLASEIWPILREDPWSYRFFPFELGVFLLGMLAYHAYQWIPQKWYRRLTAPMAMAMFIFLFSYEFLKFPYSKTAFLAIVFMTIPFLFYGFCNQKWDRQLGELSYPIYLCHLLVMQLARDLNLISADQYSLIFLAVVILSIVLALLEAPLEKWRQKNVRKNSFQVPRNEIV